MTVAPGSLVQTVKADLSQIGGSQAQSLADNGDVWTWTGTVTPSVAGARTIAFVAMDDKSAMATETVEATVTAGGQQVTIPPAGQEGDNIALGCPYTWGVAPNMEGYVDPKGTYLTDGRRASDLSKDGNSWVGMHMDRAQAWTTITIDLGDVQPIQGASFSTIACTDGQEWPLAIGILVSDDGVNYYHAGELTSLSAEHGLPTYTTDYTWSNITHCYWTRRLDTHGRFVRLVVANYPYTLVDEIEVYRGDNGMLGKPLSGSPITDIPAYVRDNKVRSGIIRRIVLDAQDVSSQVRAAPSFTGQEALGAQLAGFITQATALDGADLLAGAEAAYWSTAGNPSQFRAILPLNNLHRDVFRALASLWRSQGRQGLVVWQTPLWDSLSPTQTPTASKPGANVAMMRNEYRAAAVNLSNATDADVVASVNVTGLPGGTNPPYVTVQPVPWTDTQRGVPVAAALPVAASGVNGFAVRIPSGMTVQVWLTFHPTDVPAGTYTGTITVNGGAAGTSDIPIQLRVSTLVFPRQPSLSLGGWDATDVDDSLGLTRYNRAALIAHLRKHFVDTPWGTVYSMWPKPVPANPLERTEYFRPFDEWVARWQAPGSPDLPDVRHYYIHMMGLATSFAGYAIGTPEFDTGVGQWIRDWTAHWRDMGLRPDQIGLLIMDEPTTQEQCDMIKGWALAIRGAFLPGEPRVCVWQDQILTDDPINPGTGQLSPYLQQTFDLCDVLCPNRVTSMAVATWRNIYRQQHDAHGVTLHFYACRGPARWLDPYLYYRLQAWDCWDQGATGMFYWSFRDNGHMTNDPEPASSWNEYLAKFNYSPLYLDDTTVTGSKDMEAIREGVEDYEYLAMLKSQIAALNATGNPPAEVAQAETLLNQAPARVVDDPGKWFWPDVEFAWGKQADRSAADEVRIEILDMLELLQGLSPSTP